MENFKLGFVGGGAMAEALVKGVLAAGLLEPLSVYVADHKQGRCDYLKEKYGVQAGVKAQDFLSGLDAAVLAVKPQAAAAAIAEMRGGLKEGAAVISVVAGLTLAELEKSFESQPVLRVMPNTPAAVGEAMSAIAAGKNAGESAVSMALRLFGAVGKAVAVDEKAMDAVTGLSGSGPGYAFVIMDALADAGVRAGLARPAAITLAAQALLGAAKMVLESGEHPAALRDKVASPGGTTIAGIYALEKGGVRAALMDAVAAATEKSKAMGKN